MVFKKPISYSSKYNMSGSLFKIDKERFKKSDCWSKLTIRQQLPLKKRREITKMDAFKHNEDIQKKSQKFSKFLSMVF